MVASGWTDSVGKIQKDAKPGSKTGIGEEKEKLHCSYAHGLKGLSVQQIHIGKYWFRFNIAGPLSKCILWGVFTVKKLAWTAW